MRPDADRPAAIRGDRSTSRSATTRPSSLRRGLAGLALAGAALVSSPGPTTAQSIVDLIQVNTLTAAEAGGCYVGPTGPTEATAFVRLEPPDVGCRASDPINPNICISRREFASDGPNGTAITFQGATYRRHSMSADGEFIWFMYALDLCVLPSDIDVTVPPPQREEETCYELNNSSGTNRTFVFSAAVSPRGDEVGVIPGSSVFSPANAIQVRATQLPTLPLTASYSFIQPLLYPFTLDFMTNGDWIVFDASSTSSGSGTWGIYLIRRSDRTLHTLVPPIAGYELRNPAFAQTSDDRIAFDALELATGTVTILTADLLTGDVREIATTDQIYGNPSFTTDDGALVYNQNDPAEYSLVSLRSRPLDTDGITPTGPEQPWIDGGAFPMVYRRGIFFTTPIPCPEPGLGTGIAAAVAAVGVLGRRRMRRS